ncbi:hypothetical protein M9Y10_000875 [Tritrichomonas musculus]|uniref:Myb-like domain-containing protein n=1 Tax=Tritrichomonas musculus TaxID=1915356 RepID=A0ABR2L5E7_9EUKA
MNEKSKKVKSEPKNQNLKKKRKAAVEKSSKYNNDSASSIIPDFLKPFITQEVWDQYSPIRRDSFTKLMKNPNSFFYRNRPPGEAQKYGSFSPEEEAKFLERVRYFREDLHIDDGLWGLFAVPLNGRLGYQCSNYYRYLVSEGKIKDSRYKILENGKLSYIHGSGRSYPDESYEKLEKEAFQYIKNCLEGGGSQPIALLPEHFGRRRTRKSKKDRKRSKTDKNQILTYDNVRDIPANPFFHLIDIDIPDKKCQKVLNDKSQMFNLTPVHYSPDMFTGKPMEDPYLDHYAGIVLDKETWLMYFKGNFANCEHFNIQAKNIDDLVQMNLASYNEYHDKIVNAYC